MTARGGAVALVALCLLAALAGCVAITEGPADPTATAVDAPGLPDGDRRAATVTDVIDGDTVRVEYADGETDTVRLVGVDAPETRGRTYPDEFEGVPNTSGGRRCLAAAGERATRALTDRIGGAEVTLVRDPQTDRRGRYGRLLAHVALNGENTNFWLVERGHARVYGPGFSQATAFFAAERRARDARRGLWSCADPSTPAATGDLVLSIRADPPGDDREHPNEEYVRIRNGGDEPVAVGGWTLSDAAGHEFVFPAGATIPAGGSVTVHSGAAPATDGGTDAGAPSGTAAADTAYYWDVGAVWNNDGDVATLRSTNGTVVARRSY